MLKKTIMLTLSTMLLTIAIFADDGEKKQDEKKNDMKIIFLF